MDYSELQQLAQRLLAGDLSHEAFVHAVTTSQMATLGDATLDLDRQRRCGFPEVVFGQSKSVEQLQQIIGSLLASGIEVLVTRVTQHQAERLLSLFPQARYNEIGRTLRVGVTDQNRATADEHATESVGHVVIVTAGTGDVPVAEEARETLDWMRVRATMIHDVGVAGPLRLPAHLYTLRAADAIVVIAGMEGALPSVVGGYVACPVIAVPTSVGYGASFQGIAALLGMLNSCAANVTVVNIDAGFKAAYVAGLIAQRSAVSGQRSAVSDQR
jgi:NCAIR mutase (PurE)-related protein